MAAELSTGALVMHYIKTNHIKAAMLVTGNKAIFSKKATGRITFACADVNLVEKAFQNAISTGESQIIWMKSIGTNEKNEIISVMDFEWSIKIK